MIPKLIFPKRTVIKLSPDVYFCTEVRILMDSASDKISYHAISQQKEEKAS